MRELNTRNETRCKRLLSSKKEMAWTEKITIEENRKCFRIILVKGNIEKLIDWSSEYMFSYFTRFSLMWYTT